MLICGIKCVMLDFILGLILSLRILHARGGVNSGLANLFG